jgi:hypothetical protein
MPFKPNYRFERIERERKKQAKKEEKKLKRQQERSASGEPSNSPEIDEENSLSES